MANTIQRTFAGQQALYILSSEDPNNAFRSTFNEFLSRVRTAAENGLKSRIEVVSSIYDVEKVIEANYLDGLTRLYFRAHGAQSNGRGFAIVLQSNSDGGYITSSPSERLKKTITKICQAVQPGGMLIFEGCNGGRGKDNVLKFLAGLCNPNVIVVGSKGSNHEVEFDPNLNMHTRFIDADNYEDLTRIYYSRSEKAQNILPDQFAILWNFLRKKISPDDHHTRQRVYSLCYQLLGERNDPEALKRIKRENAELLAGLMEDAKNVEEDFKKLTFSKKDVSRVWQEMLTDLENVSDFFGHQGEKEIPITSKTKERLEAIDNDSISFTLHSSNYHAAYQFLLSCAVMEKYKIIGILYDNCDPRTIFNPGAMIMHALVNQSIHTSDLSLTVILSQELTKIKQCYLLAKKHTSEEPMILQEWFRNVIGGECGSCFNRYIELNAWFYLTRLAIESNAGLKIAVQNDHGVAAIRGYLSKGADLNHVYSDGRTIWNIAMEEGSLSSIEFFLFRFPEEEFFDRIQQIFRIADPFRKVVILSQACQQLLDKGAIIQAQKVILMFLQEINMGKQPFVVKVMFKSMILHYFEKVKDVVQAERICSQLLDELISDVQSNGTEEIEKASSCKFEQVKQLEVRVFEQANIALKSLVHATNELMFLHDRSCSAIRTWLYNPANADQIHRIQSLDLSVNPAPTLAYEIGLFTGLKQLNLENSRCRTLSEQITKLEDLKVLLLKNSALIKFPDQIAALQNLENLDLTSNPLCSLPKEIGKLQRLKGLFLENTDIDELPSQIGELQVLESLALGYNKLASLPSEVGNLKCLRVLSLEANVLQEVPMQIVNLKLLEELYLGDNKLKGLPDQIGGLKRLTVLNLDYNALEELPESIGKLKQLLFLDLNGNKLKKLPVSIGNLEKLLILSLRSNKLEEIPVQIQGLIKLKDLLLGDNQLKELPSEIGKLQDLEKLSLKNNMLTKIPPEIGSLHNLKRLYLANNKLTEIPLELRSLKNLKKVTCDSDLRSRLPIMKRKHTDQLLPESFSNKKTRLEGVSD